jgi:hypothetical protein
VAGFMCLHFLYEARRFVKILRGENLPPDRDLNAEVPESETIATLVVVTVTIGIMKRETKRNFRVLRRADW